MKEDASEEISFLHSKVITPTYTYVMYILGYKYQKIAIGEYLYGHLENFLLVVLCF